MPRKRFTSEQIIGKLQEAEVALAKGRAVPLVCKQIGVTEQTYYRWRPDYYPLHGTLYRRLVEPSIDIVPRFLYRFVKVFVY